MATQPKTTKLEGDSLDAPQTTSAGDAPADTFDGLERASSATPDKATAAEAGHQTVNAVIAVDPIVPVVPSGTRTETYQAFNAKNEPVNITHNYDTGATSVTPPSGG